MDDDIIPACLVTHFENFVLCADSMNKETAAPIQEFLLAKNLSETNLEREQGEA